MEPNTAANSVLVLDIEGPRLDATNAPALRDLVAAEIDRGNARIVLNMRGVQFVDSSGIGVLVGLLKRIAGRGDFALAALAPAVTKAFKLTKMDRVFAIFPDAAAAVAHIEAQ